MRFSNGALALVPAVVLTVGVHAQEQAQTYERLALRVNAVDGPRRVTVDRGSTDLLEVGDRVLFLPKDGNRVVGQVLTVAGRTAVVELLDESGALEPGTRGEALLPAQRVAAARAAELEAAGEAAVEGEGEGEEPAVMPPWQEDEWEEGMPLLAQVRAVRPRERAIRMTGRAYLLADATVSSDSDRSNSLYRLGGSVLYENPFGRGGGLHLDGEVNYRTLEVPDRDDEADSKLRLDRLSYYEGGTRFEDSRWEAGRFLQYGMPEFGVLDGYEYGRRLDNGDTVGGSIGYMPEPDADFETGQDFQIAGFYRHVIDESQLFTVDGGFQKTYHDGAPDRDLFVAKVSYVPLTGWNVFGTAWIDFYGSSDTKNAVELTQAYVTATRRAANGDGINFTYNHQEFPELDRDEFTPITLDELADNHNDRLSFSSWMWTESRNRYRASIGGWVDQDDSGGDLELGMDVEDALMDGGQAAFTLFGADGRFSTLFGGRVHFTRFMRTGEWDLYYEMAQHESESLDEDQDDLLQHRIGLGRDYYTESGWTISVYAEGLIDDDEDYLSLGLYVQRNF